MRVVPWAAMKTAGQDGAVQVSSAAPDVVELQYARFRRRLVAFALDYVPILGYILVLLAIGIGITLSAGPLERLGSTLVMNLIAFGLLVGPVILYFTMQESSSKRGTWGKRKLGLQVVDLRGRTLSKKRALVRSAVKFLPWQIAHTSILGIKGLPFAAEEPSTLVLAGLISVYMLAAVYVIWALVLKTHRTPYDILSGSCVVQVLGDEAAATFARD